MYKEKQYNEVSQTNLTYQKANNIVKEYLPKDVNRINHLKFKIEDKFELIHYVYSLLFSKIYNRTHNFETKEKMNSISISNCGKKRSSKKFNLICCVKIQIITIGSLEKWNNQLTTLNESPTMVFKATQEDGEIVVKNSEKRKMLEKKIEENTLKMKKNINKL